MEVPVRIGFKDEPQEQTRKVAQRDTQRQKPIVTETPPPPQVEIPTNHYVPYEKDTYAKAHQWASEQLVKKYPGASEEMATLESLIQQYLASQVTKN